MDIKADWPKIRKHFNKSFRSNFYVSLASVDSENVPTVTPIGSLFLNADGTGIYFEKFPTKLPEHAKSNHQVCLLAVNSGRWFWITSLFREGLTTTRPLGFTDNWEKGEKPLKQNKHDLIAE
ncbi:MAG: pyridoxamine 5'-phosphate oxidase family protein [Cyclobacteriaceae bacterium]